MPDILFVKTSSLGDVVHQMPAMTDARRQFPDARIAWIVEEAFAPLARLHPGVNDVVPVAVRRWRYQLLDMKAWREVSAFKARVRSIGAQTVIDTQGLIRSAIIARTSGGTRHGYDRFSIREKPATLFYDVTHQVSRTLHAVTRNRLLTGLSLGYKPDSTIDYGLRQQLATKRLPYALLFHGTSRVDKEWENSEWVKIGQWLAGQGLEVLLPWGNDRELERCRYLSGMIPRARILERMEIDAFARIIGSASFAIGVDTGPLQLAAACEVPLAAIFISTRIDLTGPVGNGPIVIFGGESKPVSAEDVIRSLEQKSILSRT